jgi:hypothetical protein
MNARQAAFGQMPSRMPCRDYAPEPLSTKTGRIELRRRVCSRRYTHDGRGGSDVSSHDSAGTHDRTPSDADPRQYRGARTDVRVVVDVDAGAFRREAASAVSHIRVSDDHHAHGKRGPVADSNRARKIDEDPAPDVTVVADMQICEARLGIVNDHPTQNANPASDPRAFGTQDCHGVVTLGTLEKSENVPHAAGGADSRNV